MPTAFQLDKAGAPFIVADPDSDLDYSLSSWLEGLTFQSAVWSMVPAVAGAIHDEAINPAPVVIDGVTYAAGELATAWIKGLSAGQSYKVTVRGTFSGGRIDDKTFTIKCQEK